MTKTDGKKNQTKGSGKKNMKPQSGAATANSGMPQVTSAQFNMNHMNPMQPQLMHQAAPGAFAVLHPGHGMMVCTPSLFFFKPYLMLTIIHRASIWACPRFPTLSMASRQVAPLVVVVLLPEWLLLAIHSL
jgi:hypothetical protein